MQPLNHERTRPQSKAKQKSHASTVSTYGTREVHLRGSSEGFGSQGEECVSGEKQGTTRECGSKGTHYWDYCRAGRVVTSIGFDRHIMFFEIFASILFEFLDGQNINLKLK